MNIIKTTFEFNFDLYQTFKQHGYTKTWKQRKAVNFKSFSLITCTLLIRNQLVNNLNLNEKVVFIIYIIANADKKALRKFIG